jgi:hypothetical protein
LKRLPHRRQELLATFISQVPVSHSRILGERFLQNLHRGRPAQRQPLLYGHSTVSMLIAT